MPLSRCGLHRNTDVAADGRFLINHSLVDATAPITVIPNWTPK